MKVLIVDDEIRVLSELSSYLSAHLSDAEIFTASSKEEAILITAEKKPRFFLVDLNLKDIDGITLIRKLRKIKTDGFFAIFSVSQEPAVLPKEVDRWIVKGGNLSEIISFLLTGNNHPFR